MGKRIVVIGAVALGPKAACRYKRLEPDGRVVMIDQDEHFSYGGCGIPYFVSGDVSDARALQETSFHLLRDEKFFRESKDIEVLPRTRALEIDRRRKQVVVERLDTGRRETVAYDKLVLATGSRPRELPVPGVELDGVFAVGNLGAAIAIRERLAAGKVERAVVVGAGFVGLEMAEALSDMWGVETAVVEITSQILPGLVSPRLAQMAQKHMEEHGVTFFLEETVQRIEGRDRVERVVTDRRTLEADLVISAIGVTPNCDLAVTAGLEVGELGGVKVNSRLQTSDPDIYAGGDCVEITNLVTGKPGHFPLGSMANRQGRVIGTNLAGGDAEFPGAVGSFAVKLFDLSVAAAGLSVNRARAEGFDALSALVCQFDRAHFYPQKDLIYLELVVEKGSGRILGIQGLGPMGDATVSRVNAVAATLRYRPTVADIANLEFAYSPPFSAAMDAVNAVANVADNILSGRNRVIEAEEFADLWQHRHENGVVFLDCRGWGNAEPFVNKYPQHWKSIPQDELRRRLGEVPADNRIVLICNTGVRSYEAQVTLDHHGIHHTHNLQGGIAALKKWGLDPLAEEE